VVTYLLHRDDVEPPPGLHRLAAVDVAQLVMRINLEVIAKTYAGDFHLETTLEVAGDSAEERKAHADQLAEQAGATTAWRNGYYLARIEISVVAGIPVDPPVIAEIHFAPLILASDLADGEAGEAA
jgi:hypothetical protein